MSHHPDPQEERRENVQRDEERPEAEQARPARELSDDELDNIAAGLITSITVPKLISDDPKPKQP
jgi:hypothetical protein